MLARHNEVAPGQFEIAPIYENSNIAADHQQLTMQTIRNTARKYGLAALLHEKPFAGINGSGKHCNWSMGTDSANLLEPGETPQDNLQFLFFTAAVIRAVNAHQDVLRLTVASASNDHRLGANEAPPAIISIFLGDQLTDIFDRIASGKGGSGKKAGILELGTPVLPPLPRHAGDRNRTSPFAFTGNKFEFRAVGSSQSISFPITVLNTIVAESIDALVLSLEAKLKKKTTLEVAILEVVKEVYVANKRIIFNGDGYSQAWHKEAAKRGLLNLPTALDAIEVFSSDKNIKLFSDYGVLSHKEVESRQEIMYDIYFKTVNIEGETTAHMAQTQILPAALLYLADLSAVNFKSKAAERIIKSVSSLTDQLSDALEVLKAQNAEQGGDTVHEKAYHLRDNVLPAMLAVREAADQLEGLVSEQHWNLPSYREMLFVK